MNIANLKNAPSKYEEDLTATTILKTTKTKKTKKASSQIIGISRSISACKRCRQKKIKCSHDFPKCASCAKSNVECVSIDPATGREIPRSYIVHLESKVEQLEQKLKKLESTNHAFTSPSLNYTSPLDPSPINSKTLNTNADQNANHILNSSPDLIGIIKTENTSSLDEKSILQLSQSEASLRDSKNPISFAKLMFTAVHFKEHSKSFNNNGNNHTKQLLSQSPIDPTTLKFSSRNGRIALLPPKQQALDLLSQYFAQSNSQLPIFHREEFLKNYFQPIYGDVPPECSFASTYTSFNREFLLNIPETETWYHQYALKLDEATGGNQDIDPFDFSASVKVPEKFHSALFFMNIVFAIASSVTHLQFPGEISDNFKNAALKYIDGVYSSPNRLEALQSILCLTLYSLMRPCIPGVWYLLGSTLRLCVDLGLQNESNVSNLDSFTIDLRRRLFWCCYSLDRQICVYLGRPFGIPEECVNVPFPTDLDDALITKEDAIQDYSNRTTRMPSYKAVALTMFRIRKLQAEIQSILYDGKELSRRFANLNEWFLDISERLEQWKSNAPKTQRKMNCDFNFEFFYLNYNHAKIMLYGLSPVHFALTNENYINLADASRGVLLSYYELYSCKLLNYTWAATHNTFMAGMSFLYSIFNCEKVRQQTSVEELKKVILCCNMILTSLIDKCDAALQSKDILEILTAAVMKLKYNVDSVHAMDMTRLPSGDAVATLQPGGHMTENMKTLMLSIPESIKLQSKRSFPYEPEDNFIFKKKSLDTPDILSTPSSMQKINISSNRFPPLPAYMPSNMAFSEQLWSTNEVDLARFFEEVKNAESPVSSMRSYSSNSESQGLPVVPTNEFNNNNNISLRQRNSVNSVNIYDEEYGALDEAMGDSLGRRKSKEAQKVYRMMYETTTESIWDQFFAAPYRLDDLNG